MKLLSAGGAGHVGGLQGNLFPAGANEAGAGPVHAEEECWQQA